MIDPEYSNPNTKIHKNFVSLREAFEEYIHNYDLSPEEIPQIYDVNKISENTYLIEYSFSDTPAHRKKAVKLRKKYLGFNR